MKKNLKTFTIFLFLFTTLVFTITGAKANIVDLLRYQNWTPTNHASWDFMKSAGGIKIGTPVRKTANTVSLPIICDVSGLSAITQNPTTMNSALAVYKIDVEVEKNKILISVVTGLISQKHNNICQPTTLYNIPSGKYDVFYYDAHRKYSLGSTLIP